MTTACTIEEAKLVEIIVEQHFSILDTLGNIGIVWWVSATTLCAGLLREMYRLSGSGQTLSREIIYMVTAFIVSIILFGFMMALLTAKLENELVKIVGYQLTLKYPTGNLFDLSIYSYLVGSSSFFVFLMCWLYTIRDVIFVR